MLLIFVALYDIATAKISGALLTSMILAAEVSRELLQFLVFGEGSSCWGCFLNYGYVADSGKLSLYGLWGYVRASYMYILCTYATKKHRLVCITSRGLGVPDSVRKFMYFFTPEL